MHLGENERKTNCALTNRGEIVYNEHNYRRRMIGMMPLWVRCVSAGASRPPYGCGLSDIKKISISGGRKKEEGNL